MTHHYDSSASGYIVDSFEGISREFTDVEILSMIVEGEPLYLDNLRQDGRPPIAYVCGKKTGVWFEYL